MEYTKLINKARRNIAKSQIKESFQILYELPLSNVENQELLVLESRFSNITSDDIKGIIKFENRINELNHIASSLLNFIQKLNIFSKSSDSILKEKIRVHFFSCDFDTSQLKKLILIQNKKQVLFSFGISNWEYFSKKSQLEKVIVDKQFTSKLNFVDEIIKNVSNLPADSNNKTIDLVITSLLIPGNHYSWNSKDRKGIIISKGILDQQFQGDNNVNKMIVKVIQRMLVYSKEINELKAHLDSHGCLFDYNVRIKELETVVEMNYLCDECIDKILKEKNGKEAYKKISEWIDNNV